MTLEEYKEEFIKKLKHKYGIDPNDCTDDESIKQAFNMGQTAQEFVDQIGEKLDLWEIER